MNIVIDTNVVIGYVQIHAGKKQVIAGTIIGTGQFIVRRFEIQQQGS